LTKIDFHILPNTIKDAITVTANIGLQYLWIDVLCIAQDNIEFKDSEIPKMANIYSTATVTILASRANGVHEGFLHRREELDEIRGNTVRASFAYSD
jgi:hypothetical protein